MTALPPFQQVLDAHGPDIHRFLVAYAGRGAADDLWQETFLAALSSYPSLRDASNLRGWLFTIARRKSVDGWRREADRPRPVGDVPDTVGTEEEAPLDTEVWAHVRELPDGQRWALALRYGADLSYREVGELLDCSEAAARQRVRAGLASLRQRMSEEEIT